VDKITDAEKALGRVRHLIDRQQRTEGINLLAQILREHPSNQEAWCLLGQTLDDPSKKIYAFERVIKLDPHHKEAIGQLQRLRGKSTSEEHSPFAHDVNTAAELLLNGKRENAKDYLVGILRQDPENERAWYLLGLAIKDPAKKEYAYRQVLKINPTNLKAKQKLRKLKEAQARYTGVQTASGMSRLEKIKNSTFYRVTTFMVTRALTIMLTIIVGVFCVIMIANKTGQIDYNVAEKIELQAYREAIEKYADLPAFERSQLTEELIREREEAAGLHLPYLFRNLRWTFNALTLNWGNVIFSTIRSTYPTKGYSNEVRDIVLGCLPNTLLLVGTSYLIIFLVGIPISLSLSRKHGKWQDRLISFLAPLSSIPSWVHGVLLMIVFAAELRLLPFGGMYDNVPPETQWGYIPIVAKHMVLPVLAIVISLIFYLVYTWRTFFLIYSDEDYVDLAKAKGLSSKKIEKSYILKPSFPFVFTSFALTLVSFWQTTTALEVIFFWPGLGKLYIDSLPHFWGEVMFPGELIISVAIVVIFAYLLGFMVLTLDVVYALVDPRIRVGKQETSVRIKFRKRRRSIFGRRKRTRLAPGFPQEVMKRRVSPVTRKKKFSSSWLKILRNGIARLKPIIKELSRYPSAVVGVFIISILVAGSIYALVALPYADIGANWAALSPGRIYTPRLAWPEWTNLFRKEALLSTMILNEENENATKFIQPVSAEKTNLLIAFTFDYQFAQIPEEISVYFTPHHEEKRPFINMTWIKPDGSEIEFKGLSVDTDKKIDLADYLPGAHATQNVINIQTKSTQEESDISKFHVLFSDPNPESDAPQKGEYVLAINAILFEEGADLDAELVALGQVFGAAGTDYMRRELLTPLLWGMPFALAFGLFGAVLTTVISMLISAVGVWLGGWVDTLVQRITDANMILPILAVCVLLYAIFGISLWEILAIIVVMNIFGSPTKSFRAAFLQIKNAPYIEAAQAYGATNRRIVLRYMLPRIIPVIIPQLVALIPSFVFLEATLGMFNIKSVYPTWGKVIYEALKQPASWGSPYWILEPLALLLLTGFAFAMVGYSLDRILNPRLQQ
jgi:peptide/nickel transport system permease protein